MNTATEKQIKLVVPTEVALKEITDFLRIHKKKEFRRKKMTVEKIKKDYADSIEAIEDGFLTFENNKPKYKLRTPLFADAKDKSLVITEVSFRSRVRAADKNLLMDGLDVSNQLGTYTIKYISFITQLSMTEVKELETEDFDTLNQICSVF